MTEQSTSELNKLIMLIGLPGSGKSTWRKKYVNSLDMDPADVVIISMDDVIEKYAKEKGINYNEAWKEMDVNSADKEIRTNFVKAIENNKKLIIIDRTNMSKKSRKWFLDRTPKNYIKEAEVFDISSDLLNERLSKREAEEGKTIPPFVIKNMKNNFERPDLEEFDIIKIPK